LVSGRLIQTNLQQVDANRFLSSIEKANQITFLTVFLLGTVALPEGYGASIYFGWPPYQNWKYLGSLTNAKPSAVYRLRSKQSNHGIDVDMDQFDENIVAQIGISIEPMETIEQRMQETLNVNTTSVSTADMQEFATKYALSYNLFDGNDVILAGCARTCTIMYYHLPTKAISPSPPLINGTKISKGKLRTILHSCKVDKYNNHLTSNMFT